MRFCPNCGVKVFDDEAKFCIECGSALTAKSITSTQSNTPDENLNANTKKSISVKRGQKADLTKNNPNLKNIAVKLSWQCDENFDLDAAAFLLANNGKVKDETDFVYYNNIKHSSDSVEHKSIDSHSEQLKIDISKIPTEVTRMALTLTINDAESLKQNFSQIKNITLQVISEDSNEELLKYILDDDFSIETAIVVAEIYRYKEDWKFNAIGAGFQGGLAALCNNFGIDIE